MRTSTRRAVTVSAGTLVLCLSGAGAALAETVPSPDLGVVTGAVTATAADCPVPPSPDQVTACATDAVTTVVTTVEKAAGVGSGSGDATAKPARKPAAAPRAVTRHATTARPVAHVLGSAARPTSLPALGLPATTASMAVSGRTPAVAAAASPVRLQSAASPLAPLDKGAPANVLRAVLIALAAASAGALAVSHLGIARLGLGRIAGSD